MLQLATFRSSNKGLRKGYRMPLIYEHGKPRNRRGLRRNICFAGFKIRYGLNVGQSISCATKKPRFVTAGTRVAEA